MNAQPSLARVLIAISAASQVTHLEVRRMHVATARAQLAALQAAVTQAADSVDRLEQDLVRRGANDAQGSLLLDRGAR